MATFNFCPNSIVVSTVPPEPGASMQLNGWTFTAKPTVPYQRQFKVKLFGLRWYTNPSTGVYDSTTAPTVNARALELFYAAHQTWQSFTWTHPHLGVMTCRFARPVEVPPGVENGGGHIDPLELLFIEHNPGF